MNLRIVFIFINIIQINNQYKNQYKVFLGFAKFHWGTFDEEGCPSTLLTQTPREKYKCARRDTSQNRYCLGDSPWRVLLRHPDLFALQEKSQVQWYFDHLGWQSRDSKKSWFDNLGGGPSSHDSVSPRIEFLIPKPLNRRMIVLVCGLSDFHLKLEFVRDLVQFNTNTGMEIALLEGMVPI